MVSIQFIGVDVSKDKFDVALHHSKTKHHSFQNNTAGYRAFFTWLSSQTNNPYVCLEATGIYSEPLAEYCYDHHIPISMVNPLQIKYFAKSQLARHKTDNVDAALIAAFASKHSLTPFVPRSKQHKQLRELMNLLQILTEQRTKLNLQAQTATQPLTKQLTQDQLTHLQCSLKSLLKQAKLIVQQHAELDEHFKRLLSIKGLGELSVLKLLAYLPTLKPFKSAKSFAAFCGLVPRLRQSGRFTGRSCLSKFGNPAIRNTLYMPALVAMRHAKELNPFITRLQANGLAPKAIVGAVMRKLAHIVFAVLKHQTTYNPRLVCDTSGV